MGDFNALSNIAAFNTVRLFQAWLQKEWRDGAIAMRIGQIGADDDFMVSENAGLFVNSAFGPLPTESANIGAPIFPLGAPGLWGSFRITENANFQFGIYSGDAGEEEVNDDGLKFGLGGGRGYVLFLEAGSEIEINGMPGVYKIGGFYHTGDFENFGSGLIAPGSIPRSLLRTFNFEIWKLKCLGACPEDLYWLRETPPYILSGIRHYSRNRIPIRGWVHFFELDSVRAKSAIR